MSWLRNHVRHYVVPGLKALARAEREYEKTQPKRRDIFGDSFFTLGGGYSLPQKNHHNLLDITRTPVNMRPARGCATKELGIVLAACKCFGINLTWSQEQMIRGMNIDGVIPKRAEYMKNKTHSPQDQIHVIVKRSLRSLKRILKKDPRRKLILPGRDVWLWKVQAEKMSVPHIFDARISRGVARDSQALKSIVDQWGLDEHSIIFDTGFAGSIYERICSVSGLKCINLMLSTGRKNKRGEAEQLYPNHQGARGKALVIEYLPKYQKTGTVQEGKPAQYMAELDEFLKATVLTIWFWHYRSPKWIDQGNKRCKVVDCLCRSCLLWKGGEMIKAMA